MDSLHNAVTVVFGVTLFIDSCASAPRGLARDIGWLRAKPHLLVRLGIPLRRLGNLAERNLLTDKPKEC